MNKRTEIAKDVLAAMLSNPWTLEQSCTAASLAGREDGWLIGPICTAAIKYADELIKQLDKSDSV